MRKYVVIPCRNEVDNIAQLVSKVRRTIPGVIVVVADDNSTDGTGVAAINAGALLVHITQRDGLSDVYRIGLLRALRDAASNDACIVEMDAGGSHDPEQLTRFFGLLAMDSCDVAAGCRFGRDAAHRGSFKRKALSWLGTRLVNAVHGTYYKDATSGFIGYRKEALQLLLERPYEARGHYYQTEVRLRARQLGLHLQEVPITYTASSSSLNMASIREALDLVVR